MQQELLNCYKLANKISLSVKGKYESFSSGGLLIVPECNHLMSALLLSLFREIAFKSEKEHMQHCLTKMTDLHARLESPELTFRAFAILLKPYSIHLAASKKVAPAKPEFDMRQTFPERKKQENPFISLRVNRQNSTPPDLTQIFPLLEKISTENIKPTIEQSINLIINCIRLGTMGVQRLIAEDITLVMGDTGVGKSTCINYLLGCDMVRNGRNIEVSSHSKMPEVVKIGHGYDSKTFMPEVKSIPNNPLFFCDTPGFYDTRSPDLRIANAVNIRTIFSLAKSVKILLLLPASTILDCRSRLIKESAGIIHELFGSKDKTYLANFAKSLLIGVTKRPVMDGKLASLTEIRAALLATGLFPENWIPNVFILDPLITDKVDDVFGPPTWLTHIKNLEPILTAKLFKTVLTAEDIRYLLDLSKAIAEKIMAAIHHRNPAEAANYLLLLSHLKVIDHDEIDLLYQENVSMLCHYVQEQAWLLKKKMSLGEPEVKQDLANLENIIAAFTDILPELKDKMANFLDYAASITIQKYLDAAESALEDLTNIFYKSSNAKLVVAGSIIDATASIRPTTPANFSQTLNTLSAMQNVPGMGEFVFEYMKNLFELLPIIQEKEEGDYLDRLKRISFDALNQLIMTSRQYLLARTKAELQLLELDVYDSLAYFTRNIQWKNNGKLTLSILERLPVNAEFKQLLSSINELARVEAITSKALFLRLVLVKIKMLTHYVKDNSVLDAQTNHIQNHLLELKTKLHSCYESDENKRLAALNHRREMEQKLAEKREQLRHQAEKKLLLAAQLEKLQQRQQALRERAEAIAAEKANLKQLQLERAEKQEELAFKKQAQQLKVETLKKSLEEDKKRVLERKQEMLLRQRKLEEKKQALIVIQQKKQQISQNHETILRKKESLQQTIRAKKEAVIQRAANIEVRKVALAGKQAKIKHVGDTKKRLELRKHEELIAKAKLQKTLAIKASAPARSTPQVSLVTPDEIAKRAQFKVRIAGQKRDIRGYSLYIKTNPREASTLKLGFIYPTAELLALEEKILQRMIQARAPSAQLQNQHSRVGQASINHKKMLMSCARLINAIQHAHSSAHRDEILAGIDLDDNNDIPDDHTGTANDDDQHHDSQEEVSLDNQEMHHVEAELHDALEHDHAFQTVENDLHEATHDFETQQHEFNEDQQVLAHDQEYLQHINEESHTVTQEADACENNLHEAEYHVDQTEQDIKGEETNLDYEAQQNQLDNEILNDKQETLDALQNQITSLDEGTEDLETDIDEAVAEPAEEHFPEDEAVEQELVADVNQLDQEEDVLQDQLLDDQKELDELGDKEIFTDEEVDQAEEPSPVGESLSDVDVLENLSFPDEEINHGLDSVTLPDEAGEALEHNALDHQNDAPAPADESVAHNHCDNEDQQNTNTVSHPETSGHVNGSEPDANNASAEPTSSRVDAPSEATSKTNPDDAASPPAVSSPVSAGSPSHQGFFSSSQPVAEGDRENSPNSTFKQDVVAVFDAGKNFYEKADAFFTAPPATAEEHREKAYEADAGYVEKIGNHVEGIYEDIHQGNAQGVRDRIESVGTDIKEAVVQVTSNKVEQFEEMVDAGKDVLHTAGGALSHLFNSGSNDESSVEESRPSASAEEEDRGNTP